MKHVEILITSVSFFNIYYGTYHPNACKHILSTCISKFQEACKNRYWLLSEPLANSWLHLMRISVHPAFWISTICWKMKHLNMFHCLAVLFSGNSRWRLKLGSCETVKECTKWLCTVYTWHHNNSQFHENFSSIPVCAQLNYVQNVYFGFFAFQFENNRIIPVCYVLMEWPTRRRIVLNIWSLPLLVNFMNHCFGIVCAVRPVDGDSHPLGSLPLGTHICCVEKYPGDGGKLARAAGVSALLLRRQDEKCVVRLPSKREVQVSSRCTATVGRVSNIDHNKRVIGKAGRNRQLGIRPRSGLWHRKTGRFGHKIHPPAPVRVYGNIPPAKPVESRFTLSVVPGIRQYIRYWHDVMKLSATNCLNKCSVTYWQILCWHNYVYLLGG